jgi:hypothetical protein
MAILREALNHFGWRSAARARMFMITRLDMDADEWESLGLVVDPGSDTGCSTILSGTLYVALSTAVLLLRQVGSRWPNSTSGDQ